MGRKKLTDEEKWKVWRHRVFMRDRFTCQLCGQRGNYLEPHHIKRKFDYPKLKYNVHNGITLCGKCHAAVTGLEYEWAPILKKILQKKLTMREWNKFLNTALDDVKTQLRAHGRLKVISHINSRIKGWQKRKSKRQSRKR